MVHRTQRATQHSQKKVIAFVVPNEQLHSTQWEGISICVVAKILVPAVPFVSYFTVTSHKLAAHNSSVIDCFLNT